MKATLNGKRPVPSTMSYKLWENLGKYVDTDELVFVEY